MNVPDPDIDITQESWKDGPALTDRDYTLLKGFHKRLDKDTMETCSRCMKCQFHMNLDENYVCQEC